MSEHQHSVTTDTAMERPFMRVMLGVGVVIGLFYFASKAFEDVIDSVVESKYEWVSDRFAKSINHIHKEWMISGRPNSIVLDYYLDETTTTSIRLQLNKQGWPLNVSESDTELNCLNLWMLFAHNNDHAKSIMDLTSNLDVSQTANRCEFYHETEKDKKLLFNYDLNTGRVSNSQSG